MERNLKVLHIRKIVLHVLDRRDEFVGIGNLVGLRLEEDVLHPEGCVVAQLRKKAGDLGGCEHKIALQETVGWRTIVGQKRWTENIHG